MRFNFALPVIEALIEFDPNWSVSHIRNDEPDRAFTQELSKFFAI